jgi:hypothetical protein
LWKLLTITLLSFHHLKASTFPTQNRIKTFGRCAMNISILELLMGIALAKILIESLDFVIIWERWMNTKDMRFKG